MNVLILFILNVFLVGLTGEFVYGFFYSLTPYVSFMIFLSVFMSVWIFTFCMHSFLGVLLFKTIRRGRSPTKKEAQRIEVLLSSVQKVLEVKVPLPSTPIDIVFEDSPFPQISSLGNNTFFLSRTLFEISTDQELKSIFAHLLFQIHSGYSQRTLCVLGLSFIPLSFGFFLKKISFFFFKSSENIVPKKKEALPFIGIRVLSLLVAFFIFIAWVFTKTAHIITSLIVLKSSSQFIFKGDLFVLRMGLEQGLLSFLEKTKEFDLGHTTFWDFFSQKSPKAMIRISRLEKAKALS